MSYVHLMLAWLFYFGLHSFLADLKVKNYFYSLLPSFKNWYRLTYNLIALTGLILLIYFSIQQESLLWEFQSWHWMPLMIFGLPGLIIMGLSVKAFDLPEFLGLKKSESMDKGASEKGLIQSGLYAYVRHPLYSGTLLFVFSLVFLYPSISLLVFLTAMIFYLPIGIYLEERKLILEFGEEYQEYSKKVSRLIPGIY
jgi:protein-S-isoprenylcysteine O-methyltransferase Ste14